MAKRLGSHLVYKIDPKAMKTRPFAWECWIRGRFMFRVPFPKWIVNRLKWKPVVTHEYRKK